MATAVFLLLASALADEPVEATDPCEPGPKNRISALVLPAVGYNSTDGLGLGLGGQVFSRPKSVERGYAWKASLGVWATQGLRYQSHYLSLDTQGKTSWIGTVGYRRWNDLRYAGEGGADIVVDYKDAERHNFLAGEYGFLGVAVPQKSGLSPYVQAYGRHVQLDPAAGGLLDVRQPYGSNGGTYTDLTVGVEWAHTDRWPLPIIGTRAEAGVSGGITVPTGASEPVGAVSVVHGEVIHWQSLFGDRWVMGSRFVADRAFGLRPIFEQDVAGGRWRDDLGSDQLLSGYGRTRTRGNGVLAAMIESRSYLFGIQRKFWNFDLYASAYAEEGFLFADGRWGPHLPSLGAGPEFLWHGALQLRPYVAWGWRADSPGGPRAPRPQFGISFLDPL